MPGPSGSGSASQSLRYGHALSKTSDRSERPVAQRRNRSDGKRIQHRKRLRNDYWLYVVFYCATQNPSLNLFHDPATLDWQPIVRVEHYRLKMESAKHQMDQKEDWPPYTPESN